MFFNLWKKRWPRNLTKMTKQATRNLNTHENDSLLFIATRASQQLRWHRWVYYSHRQKAYAQETRSINGKSVEGKSWVLRLLLLFLSVNYPSWWMDTVLVSLSSQLEHRVEIALQDQAVSQWPMKTSTGSLATIFGLQRFWRHGVPTMWPGAESCGVCNSDVDPRCSPTLHPISILLSMWVSRSYSRWLG